MSELKDKYHFEEGELLLINKPLTWTSFDAVSHLRNFLRRYTGNRKIKVGHAGTLDPLATGLLLICTGKFTKKINDFVGLDKEYTGTFILGATTPSFDKETEVDRQFETSHITKELLHEKARTFIGETEQVPPNFSAIRFKGTPAYIHARKKRDVVLEPRKVYIESFDITRFDFPEVDFRISCSKGTYIRAIARDFGQSLQSGAYLASLCRTRIGNFYLSDAFEPKAFSEMLGTIQE